MEKGDDPYEILGVGYDATEDEIKKTYRKLALKNHPDRHQNEEDKEKAHDVFSKISAAYDTLTDPVKRYDWKNANEHKINGTGSSGSSSVPTKKKKSAPTSKKANINGFRKSNSFDGKPRRKAHHPSGNATFYKQPAGSRPRSTSPKRAPTHQVPRSRHSVNPNDMSNGRTPGGAGARPPPPNWRPKFGGGDDQSVKSNRSRNSTATAPATDSSRASSRSENFKAPQNRGKSENPRGNPSTAYSSTPGTKEYFVSPTARPKPKVNTTGFGTRSPKSKTARAPNRSTEDSHTADTSYSMSGTNGQPIERTYSPHSVGGTRRKMNNPGTGGRGRMPGMPDLDASIHSTRSASTGQRKSRLGQAQQQHIAANGPVPTKPTSHRSQSHSPRPGARKSFPVASQQGPKMPLRKGKRSSVPTPAPNSHVDDHTSTGGRKAQLHNPYETFERLLKQEFPEDYWERDWKKDKGGGGFLGSSKKRTMQAKTKDFDPNSPATIVSMSMSTKKEKRVESDGKTKVIDIKTITKILRLDGTVDKVLQASVADKEQAKGIEEETITITREKTIKDYEAQQEKASRKASNKR